MDGIDYLSINQALWDERVPIHLDSVFYDVPGFRAGGTALRGFEIDEVGDVSGRDLVHLQCHIGLDTLSWARRGARVTGLDFSEPAIRAATALAAEAEIPARFVTAEVHDAVAVLDSTYDIVYTGIGALCWLPDITRWAATVSALLEPGGFLYLAEFHPFADTLDDVHGRTVTFDYFTTGAQVFDDPDFGSYADPDAAVTHSRSVEFHHGIGQVLTALIEAGLRIDFLHEHDFTLFRRFTDLEQHGDEFRFPAGRPRSPMMYSLRATK